MKALFGWCLALTAAASLSAETVAATAEPVTLQLKDGTELKVQAAYEVEVNAQKPAEPPRRKVALFVDNCTGEAAFSQACEVFRAQLAAQVAGAEVEILDAASSVYAIAPRKEQRTDGTEAVSRDERLNADTSRLRLAEHMGADYLLVLSLDRFSKNVQRLRDKRFGKAIDASGTVLANEVYKISGSYTVSDVYSGSAFDGGKVTAQRAVRQSAGLETEFGTYADGLEEDLAEKMAALIRKKSPAWREASMEKSGIPVNFKVLAYDMNNKPIYLPAVAQDNSILNDRIPSEIAATVEVDGIARGTSGCTVRMSRGIHSVRISRPGYDDVTLAVVPSEELTLTVSLRMTPAEYARVKDSIEFMHRLTMEREQNMAAVEERKGHAKMLEQSGFRVTTDRLPETIVTPVMNEWLVPVKREMMK